MTDVEHVQYNFVRRRGGLGWGEERNTAELQKERRLRSRVCKWGFGEGNGIKRVGKTHTMPAAVFVKFRC